MIRRSVAWRRRRTDSAGLRYCLAGGHLLLHGLHQRWSSSLRSDVRSPTGSPTFTRSSVCWRDNPIYPAEQLSGPYVLPNVTLFGYAYPPSSVPLFIPFASWPFGLCGLADPERRGAHHGPVRDPPVTSSDASARSNSRSSCSVSLSCVASPTVSRSGTRASGLPGCLLGAGSSGVDAPQIGLLAGLGATIKLVPGTMIFWSTPKTFPRVLAHGNGHGRGAVRPYSAAGGHRAWFDYVRALSYSEPACGVDFPTSIACTFQPVLGIGTAKLAGIALAVVAGVLAVIVTPRLLSFALVVVAWLAPVTDLHFHYLLVVYVLAVAAYAVWLRRRRDPAS